MIRPPSRFLLCLALLPGCGGDDTDNDNDDDGNPSVGMSANPNPDPSVGMSTTGMPTTTQPVTSNSAVSTNPTSDSSPVTTGADTTEPDPDPEPEPTDSSPETEGTDGLVTCESGDACFVDMFDDCRGRSGGESEGCGDWSHLDILETSFTCGDDLQIGVEVAGPIPMPTVEDDELALRFEGVGSAMLLCRIVNDAQPWTCSLDGAPVGPETGVSSSGSVYTITIAQADLETLQFETVTVLTYAYDSGAYLEDDTDPYPSPCG